MSFVEHFKVLKDPRKDINKQHNLLDILFLTAAAVMSGAEGWKDIKAFGDSKLDWLRKYRSFAAGIPVDDTIARVIGALDSKELVRCFIGWINELRSANGTEQIAIDGKTLRRSFDGERATALHSITAWGKISGLVLAELKSEGKKNENQSVLEMLDLLELQGTIVTMDAMNTQKKIVDKIHNKGGDYVLCVKDNHPTLHREIQSYFEHMREKHPEKLAEHYHEEINAEHGRIETRNCHQLKVNHEWVTGAKQWAGLQTIVEMKRTREIKNKVQQETQYYISSLINNAAEVADAIRSHWGVENKAHWVLDVTFREDESRIRRENAAENMGILRRLVMNLARLHPRKNSVRGKLKQAMWSDEFRAELLVGQHLVKV